MLSRTVPALPQDHVERLRHARRAGPCLRAGRPSLHLSLTTMSVPSAPQNAGGARLTEPERRQVVNRLRRARGQIDAVITQIEADGSCEEVVTQLAAASRALDKAGYKYLAGAMRECLLPRDDDLSPSSIERLFLMLA